MGRVIYVLFPRVNLLKVDYFRRTIREGIVSQRNSLPIYRVSGFIFTFLNNRFGNGIIQYDINLHNPEEIKMIEKTKRFVVTEKGQRTDILLSLKEYKALLEDLHDLAIIAERKDEPSEPISVVKEKLLRQWNTKSK
jgi:hypothetical protein